MKKDEVLKYIETQGDVDFVVRTEEENKTFLENYAQQVEQEKVPFAQKKIYDTLDEELVAVTGLKRNPSEKTTDYYKRIVNSYKSDAEKAKVFETEINDLKQKIKDGSADKKTHADLEAVQKAYKDLEDTKNSEITSLKTEYDKFKIRSEIASALSGIKFKKNIPEPALKALTDSIINDLVGIASYEGGKLVFTKDGVVMRNPHNALSEYTASELLTERLKDVREVKQDKSGGPDLTGEINKEYDKSGKLTKITLMIPDRVKTKEDLSRYLVEAGLLRGTEDYIKAYGEYSANLPLR